MSPHGFRGSAVVALALCLSLCPAYARAGNLIINGDFENGNVGFTSQYNYTHGSIGAAQSYDVLANPYPAHGGDTYSYGDHTTGHGLMMAVNNAETPGVVVWQETVSVTSNTEYAFELWDSTWSPFTPDVLDVQFNGTSVGHANCPVTPGVWQSFGATWNSGAATSATIDIYSLGLLDIGDDFALDDISLNGPNSAPAVPEPASLALALTGAGLLGWRGLRRGRRVCRPAPPANNQGVAQVI